jgi:hypothetical protein
MDNQTYDARLLELQQSASEFGKTLLAWRRQNSWTQYTIGKWAKYADFRFPSFGNLSAFEHGKNLHLRPITFIQFAELNARLASIEKQDLLKIKDKDLRQAIGKSKPIESFVTGAWSEQHFFLHFIGGLPRPAELEDFLAEKLPEVFAGSKEEAFMSLSPKRFSLNENFILTPAKMTKNEQMAVHFLCTKHGYRLGEVKWH